MILEGIIEAFFSEILGSFLSTTGGWKVDAARKLARHPIQWGASKEEQSYWGAKVILVLSFWGTLIYALVTRHYLTAVLAFLLVFGVFVGLFAFVWQWQQEKEAKQEDLLDD